MSALDLASAVRSGERSAVDVIDEHLARIDARNGEINAFNLVTADAAREAAAAVDAAVAAGNDPGPLAGVPIAIKDNMCTTGVATTCSSKILEGWEPPYDATVVQRVVAAGAVMVGKTNLDVWSGYKTSVDVYDGMKIKMLIDFSSRILRYNSVNDQMKELFNQARKGGRNRRQRVNVEQLFQKEIIGRSVLADYGNHRIYRVHAIDVMKSPQDYIKDTNETFLEYYQKNYNIKIKDANYAQSPTSSPEATEDEGRRALKDAENGSIVVNDLNHSKVKNANHASKLKKARRRR